MNKNSYLDPDNVKSINQSFRARRFAFFKLLIQRIKSDKPLSILDIGGTQSYWERMNFLESFDYSITLLNLKETPVKYKNFSSIKGDGSDLNSFEDKYFDIVFSNSVIEHLFSIENQQRMADEIRRVGKNYYVQTPNFYFPLEPHWLFPFFQFLPFDLRVLLTQNFSLGHYNKAENREDAIKRVSEVKLLTENEMKRLFPEGLIKREYYLGFVKSLTMYYFPMIK